MQNNAHGMFDQKERGAMEDLILKYIIEDLKKYIGYMKWKKKERIHDPMR